MIQQLVDRFMAAKPQMLAQFKAARPSHYTDIVRAVIETVRDAEGWNDPDPERITAIDYGHYQGTLVYVIGACGYQPSDYWYVKISYGSCSGCDTLKAISMYSSDPVTDDEAEQYWTLALHVVQAMKKMGEDEA